MVSNKIAQRAIAAGLAGVMSLGAAAPAALALNGTEWTTLPWWSLTPVSDDEGLTYWTRIWGDTRYDTMKKIVDAAYIVNSRYENAAEAVIASGENFPDALAANGVAGSLNGGNGAPVILTKKGALSSQAKTLLEKMQVQHVYIMGGTAAVSQDVENAITDLGIVVTRIAGADRQETSAKAFKAISGNWYKNYGTHSVIIATGDNFADALSIAPFAYQTGTPIVLTKKDGTLTDQQIEYIKDNDQIWNIIVVGGESAVSGNVFGAIGTYNSKYTFSYTGTRIDGVDRYETSAKIADWEVNYASTFLQGTYSNFDWDFTFVATGENFPDALAGAQLAGGSYNTTHKNPSGDRLAYLNGGQTIAWSGSPILLVKEGDRAADAQIAKSLNWRNVNAAYEWDNTAVYASKQTTGKTNLEYVEDYMVNGFFTTKPITNGTNPFGANFDDPYILDLLAYESFTAYGNTFHGIIFGGKDAVSKKVAERLDDTVADNIINTSEWDYLYNSRTKYNYNATNIFNAIFKSTNEYVKLFGTNATTFTVLTDNGQELNNFYQPNGYYEITDEVISDSVTEWYQVKVGFDRYGVSPLGWYDTGEDVVLTLKVGYNKTQQAYEIFDGWFEA